MTGKDAFCNLQDGLVPRGVAVLPFLPSTPSNRAREKGKTWSRSAPPVRNRAERGLISALPRVDSTHRKSTRLFPGSASICCRCAGAGLSGDVWILSWVGSACGGILRPPAEPCGVSPVRKSTFNPKRLPFQQFAKRSARFLGKGGALPVRGSSTTRATSRSIG
jgi:hypothetical protein